MRKRKLIVKPANQIQAKTMKRSDPDLVDDRWNRLRQPIVEFAGGAV